GTIQRSQAPPAASLAKTGWNVAHILPSAEAFLQAEDHAGVVKVIVRAREADDMRPGPLKQGRRTESERRPDRIVFTGFSIAVRKQGSVWTEAGWVVIADQISAYQQRGHPWPAVLGIRLARFPVIRQTAAQTL